MYPDEDLLCTGAGHEGDLAELAMELPVVLILLIGMIYTAHLDSLFAVDWRSKPHYFTDEFYSAPGLRARAPEFSVTRSVLVIGWRLT